MQTGDSSAYHDMVECSINFFYEEGKRLMSLFMSTASG